MSVQVCTEDLGFGLSLRTLTMGSLFKMELSEIVSQSVCFWKYCPKYVQNVMDQMIRNLKAILFDWKSRHFILGTKRLRRIIRSELNWKTLISSEDI